MSAGQACGRESLAAGLFEEAQLQCRIGIAAGPVLAGVLGRLQPRFHVVGEVSRIVESGDGRGGRVPSLLSFPDWQERAAASPDGPLFLLLLPSSDADGQTMPSPDNRAGLSARACVRE